MAEILYSICDIVGLYLLNIRLAILEADYNGAAYKPKKCVTVFSGIVLLIYSVLEIAAREPYSTSHLSSCHRHKMERSKRMRPTLFITQAYLEDIIC